jgi:tetratricopeptide (TPR) repeat protein
MVNLLIPLFILLQSYTGIEFLRIGVGSRSIAMGNAYIGISDDSYGIFYNPAGIGNIQSLHFSSFYARWFLDTDLASISSVIPLGSNGVLGFGIRGLYTNKIELRNEEDPWNYEYYSAYFLNPSIAYAKRISNFGFGVGFNGINARIESETGFSIFLNAGIAYYTELVDFGIALSNLGTKILNTGLPANVRSGLCVKVLSNLSLSADIIKPFEDDFSYNIGLEYSPVDIFTLRFGYNNDFYSESFFKKLSGGVGFNAGNFMVDYTAASSGIFGLTHFFTLSYIFPDKIERKEPKILTKEEMMSETYSNQGIRYYNQGKYEEALNSWDLSLIWDPDNQRSLILIAKAKKKLKDIHIKKFIADGQKEFKQGNYLEAIYNLEKALELDSTLVKSRDLKLEAERRLKEGISKDIAERIEQGISNFKSGEYQKAIGIWNEILKLEPENKNVQGYINQAKRKMNEEIAIALEIIDDYISQGNLKIASDLVALMLNKYHDNESFKKQSLFIRQKINESVNKHLEEGRKFMNEGEYAKAEKEFYTVLEYEPKNSKALIYLDEIKKQISRSEKENADRYYLLGIDAYTRNNYELAIEYWEKVLEIIPSYTNVEENLERAKIKLSELMK